MVLNILLPLCCPKLLINIDLNNVVYDDEAANDHGLPNLDTVDSCIDVDCICTENSNVAHINVVNDS